MRTQPQCLPAMDSSDKPNDMSLWAEEKLRILVLVNGVSPTNMAYNEFVFPRRHQYKTTICSLLASKITIDTEVQFCHAGGNAVRYLCLLRRHMKESSIDLIHVHSCHTGLIFLWAVLLTKPSALRRTVMTIHDSYGSFRWKHRLLLIPAFVFFGKLICCGRASFHSFPRIFRRLGRKRLHYIRNGVNVERVDKVRSKMDKDGGEETCGVKMLYVAAFRPIKNHLTLLKALARVAAEDVHLYLVGEGPEMEACRQAVGGLGLKRRVTFTGELSRENTIRWMARSDIFVSPSIGEGLPVALLEAMTCCCPVILSDIQPHHEIKGNVGCIPLVQPDDADGFARAIQHFIEVSSDTRHAWGLKCRNRVVRHFALSRMLAEYDKLYAEIAGSTYTM